MLSRYFLSFLFFSLSLFLSAQDISGVWTGNYKKVPFMDNPEKLVVEIFIYNDSLITGASHLYYKNNQYEHYKIKGVIRKNESAIHFSEDSTIAIKIGFMESNCLGNYTMKLASTGNSIKMTGRWDDRSSSLFHCPSTTVWLEKKVSENNEPPKAEPKHTDLERKSDIQSLIEISNAEKDSIEIALYDNGIVDNDTASLYLNDSLLVYKQFVSARPLLLYISLDKNNPMSKLKLVAENLGSIPPCTAFMVITTKRKKYEVSVSSNFHSNGVIEFFLKE